MQQTLYCFVILLVVWSELILTTDGAVIKIKRLRTRPRWRKIDCRKYPFAPKCRGVWTAKRSYPSFEDLQREAAFEARNEEEYKTNADINRVDESLLNTTPYEDVFSHNDVTTAIPRAAPDIINQITQNENKELVSVILSKLRNAVDTQEDEDSTTNRDVRRIRLLDNLKRTEKWDSESMTDPLWR